MVLDHIGRLQLFVIDHIVLAYKSQRRLMVKVLSLATYFLMCLRQQRNRFPAAVASLLST
jgi:hypothetical protein